MPRLIYSFEKMLPLFSLVLVNVFLTNRGAAIIFQSDSHRFTFQYLCCQPWLHEFWVRYISLKSIPLMRGDIPPIYRLQLISLIGREVEGDLQPTNFGLLTRTTLLINNIIFKCSLAHISLSLVHYSSIFRRKKFHASLWSEPLRT